MKKSATLLALAYGIASLLFAAIAAVMFYAMAQVFAWEFVWVSVTSMLLCHFARVQCIREIRTRRLFVQYHKDATAPASPKQSACTSSIFGQSNL